MFPPPHAQRLLAAIAGEASSDQVIRRVISSVCYCLYMVNLKSNDRREGSAITASELVALKYLEAESVPILR